MRRVCLLLLVAGTASARVIMIPVIARECSDEKTWGDVMKCVEPHGHAKHGGHKPGGGGHRGGGHHAQGEAADGHNPHAPKKRNGSRPHWHRSKDKARGSAA